MLRPADISALTCIANDYSYAEVFGCGVKALGKPGDCLIGISGSGNSENVIKAIWEVSDIGMKTIGLFGRDGQKIKGMCNATIIVSCEITARMQEAHIFIGQVLCGDVEASLGLVS